MEKGITTNKITRPTYHRTKRFISKLSQYILLILLFIFLASHENINPRLGNSHVDFYITESKHLLEINAKAWLINSSKDLGHINYTVQKLCNEFYSQRDYLPAWTINYTHTEQLENLIRIVDSAEFFGFPKTVFNSTQLLAKLNLLESNTFGKEKIGERINLEIEATQTALRYMIFMRKGIVIKDSSNSFLSFINQLPNILNHSIQHNQVKEQILAMQPNNALYKNLVSHLPQYINAYHAVSNPSEGIAKDLLSEILFYSQIIDTAAFDSINTVEKSIANFQRKNYINVNGVLNNSTVEKMAKVLGHKYNVILLNIDRLRKTNIQSGNFLFVNIPEYKLYLFNNNIAAKSFNVVVGRKKTPTPNLSSKIGKIITNPYWTVPRSIANKEMLYKIRRDSTYLQRNRYFIINSSEEEIDESMFEWESDDPLGKKYWIRQNNGGGNALGKIKFIFPNNRQIFLHDTPSKRLFKRENRAFSHGCIRLQNPIELAQYLSDKDHALGQESVNIRKSIAKRKREVFHIGNKIEIHVQYITCSVNNKNNLVFYNDIYSRDIKEMKQLFAL